MRLLLDTSVVIDALRKWHSRTIWLTGLIDDGHWFAVSVTTLAEVYTGMRFGEENKTDALFETLESLPVTHKLPIAQV